MAITTSRQSVYQSDDRLFNTAVFNRSHTQSGARLFVAIGVLFNTGMHTAAERMLNLPLSGFS